MRKKKHFYLIFIPIILWSCRNDVGNITISGVIIEAETGKTIKNADVTIVCWKYGKSPDQSYTQDETKTTVTDENGKYSVEFDKGAYVEVLVSSDGYLDEHVSQEILIKDNLIDITLEIKEE